MALVALLHTSGRLHRLGKAEPSACSSILSFETMHANCRKRPPSTSAFLSPSVEGRVLSGFGSKVWRAFLKHLQHIHGLGRCLSEKKFLAVWPRSVGMCAQSAPRTSSKVPHVRTHRWTIICIVSTAHSQGSEQSLLAQASVSVNPRVRTKLVVWGSCDGDRASAIDI